MKAAPKKSRSGTTMTYAERAANGRPTVSLTMTDDTRALLTELAEHHGLSRSGVVELALRELSKKRR